MTTCSPRWRCCRRISLGVLCISAAAALAATVARQAERLGLAPRIEWRGALAAARGARAYREADLFVLAAKVTADGDRDGLPNVLMEAQSQRLACIATRVSGIPELIEDGTTGVLVPPGDPPALAARADRADPRPGAAQALGSRWRAAGPQRLCDQCGNRSARPALWPRTGGRPGLARRYPGTRRGALTRPAMRIAFYAPLKPPDHPVPSGDRRVAQLFLAALRRAGHEPALASRFRSFEGQGDQRRQARLAALGQRSPSGLCATAATAPASAPDLWFTYHLYHKAPDWLGPRVAGALGIPYVVAEASYAPKRAGGAWDAGHRAAEHAIRRADAVIGLNPADRDCVLPLLADPARWIAIKPFLDAAGYAAAGRRPIAGPARLIAVAMMRPGDKLASYRVLGDALARLLDLALVARGGRRRRRPRRGRARARPARRRGSCGPGRSAQQRSPRHLGHADLCVWPAINEAFGMALLEAQASGLPVVAGASGGVAEIVAPGVSGLLVPPGDAAAFAAAVRQLIVDRGLRARFAAAARQRVLAEHDLSAAARRLAAVFEALRPAHAA